MAGVAVFAGRRLIATSDYKSLLKVTNIDVKANTIDVEIEIFLIRGKGREIFCDENSLEKV